jgi:hypothetical protein
MHSPTLLFIIFCHISAAFSEFLHANHSFKLPKHPSNWICTVHITAVTFANYTSTDITERILISNREQIIPSLSTGLNRSKKVAPVISFFEPCTISVHINAPINGSRYVETLQIYRYIKANAYAFRGWGHSVIIFIGFTPPNKYYANQLYLSHRLFYHSLYSGPQKTFPNHVFVPDALQTLRTIDDPTYCIHLQELPLFLSRLISRPKYKWDQHASYKQLEFCSLSRWDQFYRAKYFSVGDIADCHYQHFLNFSTVALAHNNGENYGWIYTNGKYYNIRNSISLRTIGSNNIRLIYCSHNLNSPTLRPLDLLSPFGFETWVMLAFILIVFATK